MLLIAFVPRLLSCIILIQRLSGHRALEAPLPSNNSTTTSTNSSQSTTPTRGKSPNGVIGTRGEGKGNEALATTAPNDGSAAAGAATTTPPRRGKSPRGIGTRGEGSTERPQITKGVHVLSQSGPPRVELFNSATCYHNANSYYRIYNLQDYGIVGEAELTSIQIGIEEAYSETGDAQQLYVRAFDSNDLKVALPFDDPKQELLLVNDVLEIDSDVYYNQVLSIPTKANITSGSLIVEVYSTYDPAIQNFFFLGSNSYGQSHGSWTYAPGCDDPAPARTDDMGMPEVQWVIDVVVEPIGGDNVGDGEGSLNEGENEDIVDLGLSDTAPTTPTPIARLAPSFWPTSAPVKATPSPTSSKGASDRRRRS